MVISRPLSRAHRKYAYLSGLQSGALKQGGLNDRGVRAGT